MLSKTFHNILILLGEATGTPLSLAKYSIHVMHYDVQLAVIIACQHAMTTHIPL